MPSSPRKVVVHCVFKFLAAREADLCGSPANYSAEFVLVDGRSFFLEFCSAHLPKAVSVAEDHIEEIFCDAGVRIACTQFHEIKSGYVPRTEEFLIKLRRAPKRNKKYG